MLKFYWNGIKENGGKLQRCHYSVSALTNHPANTITIYARDYKDFSPEVREAFKVDDDTDIQTDYICREHIRVEPNHPLYGAVLKGLEMQTGHNKRKADKRIKVEI